MTAATAAVTARAPAKINLSLRVGPLRADGYHTLATVFHAVHLDDLVTATPVDGGAVTVAVADEHGDPVPGVPADESNLAVRAALRLREAAGLPRAGVHLAVRKSIPVAGGMAGGSADAAASLVACAKLWETGSTREHLASLAALLGADVPFALLGGCAVGTGRGEHLEPLSVRAALHWVLAWSDTGLSTPSVFSVLDRLRAERAVTPPQIDPPQIDPRLVTALERGLVGAVGMLVDNDLEEAALELRPMLATPLAAGRQAGARAGLVSGSGPTLVFLVDAQRAARVARAVAREPGVAGVRHVTGPAPGAALVA